MPRTPEDRAREQIDARLREAGWVIQDRDDLDLGAASGIAVREFPLAAGHGTADYLLYGARRAFGVIEAKQEGYEEVSQRDKVSLDVFWLRDESLEDSANVPDPDVLAAEIAEDLQAALDQFAQIAEDLGTPREVASALPPVETAASP